MPATVEFHTGVADPVHFACRLLRKAVKSGARVLVTASPATLEALDEALWTFEAQEFLPHVRIPGPAQALASRTPVWLSAGEWPADAPPVLVNLGGPAPDDGESFDRIIEIVGVEPEEVDASRLRWRRYQGWGVKPVHHGAAA